LKQKTALITGIFGQDGSYLCELLTDGGYEVHGIENITPSDNSQKIREYLFMKGYEPQVHCCDLHDYYQVKDIIGQMKPDEIYHLAATHYSSQAKGRDEAADAQLFNRNVASTLNILTAVNYCSPQSRCVLAGSCLMYDSSEQSPQDEKTPYRTKSLYGLSKITESNIGRHFREKGCHVSTGILYNHESPRRTQSFVTKKIVTNMVLLKRKIINSFELGSLETSKDWGYAKDYVGGLWLMAQAQAPEDYIFATGEVHTIWEFVENVADILGLNDWQSSVKVNGAILNRSTDTLLVGRPSRAEEILQWRRTADFNQLIEIMVENEIAGTLG
jgi:GDPmannose 4,6-dehydratase